MCFSFPICLYILAVVDCKKMVPKPNKWTHSNAQCNMAWTHFPAHVAKTQSNKHIHFLRKRFFMSHLIVKCARILGPVWYITAAYAVCIFSQWAFFFTFSHNPKTSKLIWVFRLFFQAWRLYRKMYTISHNSCAK